jgi:hypothetical protein
MKATYEQRHIATSNYLEDGVKDDVNLADKTIMKDDGTTEAAQTRPQRIANVISFSECPISTRNSGTLAPRQFCSFSKEISFLQESMSSRVQTSSAY